MFAGLNFSGLQPCVLIGMPSNAQPVQYWRDKIAYDSIFASLSFASLREAILACLCVSLSFTGSNIGVLLLDEKLFAHIPPKKEIHSIWKPVVACIMVAATNNNVYEDLEIVRGHDDRRHLCHCSVRLYLSQG